MSYHKNFDDAALPFDLITEKHCFGCGKTITGAVVTHDGHVNSGKTESLLFHPACAAIAGQRLICDGYPHRRES